MQSMSVSFIKLLLKSIHYVVNSDLNLQTEFLVTICYKVLPWDIDWKVYGHHISLLVLAARNFRNKFYAECDSY